MRKHQKSNEYSSDSLNQPRTPKTPFQEAIRRKPAVEQEKQNFLIALTSQMRPRFTENSQMIPFFSKVFTKITNRNEHRSLRKGYQRESEEGGVGRGRENGRLFFVIFPN